MTYYNLKALDDKPLMRGEVECTAAAASLPLVNVATGMGMAAASLNASNLWLKAITDYGKPTHEHPLELELTGHQRLQNAQDTPFINFI